jgi:uncharacterized RDD family membrane protein YckC
MLDQPTNSLLETPPLAGQVRAGQDLPQARRRARAIAAVVDGLVLMLAVILQQFLTSAEGPFNALAAIGLCILWATVVLQVLFLSTTGQTLGKAWNRIRVVTLHGFSPGFRRAFLIRMCAIWFPWITVMQAIDTLRGGKPAWLVPVVVILISYWIVDAAFIFRRDRRCIHDHLAGTKVVAEPPGPVPETPSLSRQAWLAAFGAFAFLSIATYESRLSMSVPSSERERSAIPFDILTRPWIEQQLVPGEASIDVPWALEPEVLHAQPAIAEVVTARLALKHQADGLRFSVQIMSPLPGYGLDPEKLDVMKVVPGDKVVQSVKRATILLGGHAIELSGIIESPRGLYQYHTVRIIRDNDLLMMTLECQADQPLCLTVWERIRDSTRASKSSHTGP